jgi:hypothetical protein
MATPSKETCEIAKEIFSWMISNNNSYINYNWYRTNYCVKNKIKPYFCDFDEIMSSLGDCFIKTNVSSIKYPIFVFSNQEDIFSEQYNFRIYTKSNRILFAYDKNYDCENDSIKHVFICGNMDKFINFCDERDYKSYTLTRMFDIVPIKTI